jgi:[acyl-carrier-protein] S-malonyltransferase
MSKIACVFPGQGAQTVGMGKDFFDGHELGRQTFQEIDLLSGRQLSKLCFEGPESELKRTANTQPTILAVSLVAWRVYLAENGPRPQYVAGHSLGEFSAMVAAAVLSVEAAVKLVDKRSKLMESCPEGAMSAVIGLTPESLEKCCAQAQCADPGKVVVVANFNTREQLVISGSPSAVEAAGALAKAAGGKVIPLPVGGAFHSPLMQAAAKEFELELDKYQFADASVPLVQNYDATAERSHLEIKSKLAKQMSSSVKWCESIEYMLAQGVDTFIEVGPGKALTGMVKKIDRSARIFNIYDMASLKSTIDALATVAAQ